MKHNFMWVYIIITFQYKTDGFELEILDWNIKYLDTVVGPTTDLLHISSLILSVLSFSNFPREK